MKLVLKKPFTLEISDTDEVISGTLSPLSKQEQKEFEKTFTKHNKDAKALQRKSVLLNRLSKTIKHLESTGNENLQVSINEYYALEDEISADTEKLEAQNVSEDAAQKRINMSVVCDDKDRLKEICELVGYQLVLDTIIKDTIEKSGNAIKPS